MGIGELTIHLINEVPLYIVAVDQWQPRDTQLVFRIDK